MNRTLGFYLNDAGHSVVPANSVSPLTLENDSQEYALSWEKGRVLQDFQVVYISKGKGVFQSTQDGLIPINAGDAFLLFPGEWHRYQPDPEVGWTEYWLRFSGDYANKLMSSEPLSALRPVIRIGHNKALFQLLSESAEMMHSKPFFNPWVAAAQGIQVLAHLAVADQRPKSKYSDQVEAARCHIFAIVPANSGYSPTVENQSQKYVSSWRKRKVRQDFQIVYISKGKGIFQSTQSGLISINAGDALLLFPGEWYCYQPDPEVGWTQFWISFSGDVRRASRMKGAVV